MSRVNMMACWRHGTKMLQQLYMATKVWHKSTHNKEKITSRHHMHMAHGLVGTNRTRLNVKTVSTSVKQQHYHSMFASLKQRSY